MILIFSFPAVHEFLNGEYYECPAESHEIVAAIVKLREFRETEMYLTILRHFLQVHSFIEQFMTLAPLHNKQFTYRFCIANVHQVLTKLSVAKDKRYIDHNLLTEQRPWGDKGEPVNVWVISLQSLLRETKPNKYHPDGRESVMDLIKAALPPMAFPFTIDLLKDSIRLYLSPYGQVGDTARVTFPKCDCWDDDRNKAKRHKPCAKAAVVICKSIFTVDEAIRREVEEREYMVRFEEVESDIKIWLATDDGIKYNVAEVRKRQAALREDISLREEMAASQVSVCAYSMCRV